MSSPQVFGLNFLILSNSWPSYNCELTFPPIWYQVQEQTVPNFISEGFSRIMNICMGTELDANKSFHLIPSFTTLNISHFILQPTDGLPESEFNA